MQQMIEHPNPRFCSAETHVIMSSLPLLLRFFSSFVPYPTFLVFPWHVTLSGEATWSFCVSLHGAFKL